MKIYVVSIQIPAGRNVLKTTSFRFGKYADTTTVRWKFIPVERVEVDCHYQTLRPDTN